MDAEQMAEKLKAAERGIELLSGLLSEQMAISQANANVLTGLLASLGGRAGVFEAVHDQLERAQANNLAHSTNDVFVRVYEQYSRLFYAALQDAGHAVH